MKQYITVFITILLLINAAFVCYQLTQSPCTMAQNGNNGKHVKPSGMDVQSCQTACPLSLNCSMFQECAFHYPDWCSHLIIFCRNEIDADGKYISLLTHSDYDLYRNHFTMISLLNFAILFTTLLFPLVFLAIVLYFIRAYHDRKYRLKRSEQVIISKTLKKAQKVLKRAPGRSDKPVLTLCHVVLPPDSQKKLKNESKGKAKEINAKSIEASDIV